MTWYPSATKIELQPESGAQPAIVPDQFILHSVTAPWTPAQIEQYWTQPGVVVESHFGLGYNGALGQFLSTQTRADANYLTNRRANGHGAVSMESASNHGATDLWTDAQVQAIIKLGVWLHQTHGIPLRISRTWDDPGYGYHRLFKEWNPNSHSCPGDARVGQFKTVIFPAIVAQAGPKPPATGAGGTPAPTYQPFPGASWFSMGRKSKIVSAMHDRLVAVGCNKYTSSANKDTIGSGDKASYEAWQRHLGYTGSAATWPPGKTSWDKLHVAKVV
ncbi:N-acetylmuramoyl-L-alanine amidase [Actinacidiphila oryziradicis]|uniref:N-acetylmuramoyl-L-alanine amidase n=1 Tax=Actinacidiphila oryziradicis TaxID=2571141 RepID=UPI001FE97F96|nr:N-acetylmuramoyl-L-alanine amidase [Actinacidiphila oryziradicis]